MRRSDVCRSAPLNHTERLNPDPELKVGAGNSRCRWLGERMDYSMAIESMQFRDESAAKAATACAAPS